MYLCVCISYSRAALCMPRACMHVYERVAASASVSVYIPTSENCSHLQRNAWLQSSVTARQERMHNIKTTSRAHRRFFFE